MNIIDPKKFIKAGNALFTILNQDTGNRFTYKVVQSKNKKVFFVSVLNGSDNYSNYMYIGTIFPDNNFSNTPKSKVKKDSLSFRAFNWLWDRLNNNNNLPSSVSLYHEGKCGRCGRRLTVPESILSGFGPECINKI